MWKRFNKTKPKEKGWYLCTVEVEGFQRYTMELFWNPDNQKFIDNIRQNVCETYDVIAWRKNPKPLKFVDLINFGIGTQMIENSDFSVKFIFKKDDLYYKQIINRSEIINLNGDFDLIEDMLCKKALKNLLKEEKKL